VTLLRLRSEVVPAAPPDLGPDVEPSTAPPVEHDRKSRVAALSSYLAQLRRYRIMSREEEHEVAVRFHETRDSKLAERLVTANLRLVLKIALEYRGARRQLADVVQEGNLGLLHAVEKYDPHRGVKLGSYAAWWIRAYILKFILANARLVKLGTTQAQRRLFFGLRRARARLEGGTGVKVETSQLAASLSVTEQEVEEMERRMSTTEASLDRPAHHDDDRSLGDCLTSEGAGPEAQWEATELRAVVGAEVERFARRLKGRDRVIFNLRLLAEEPKTLAEIAEEYDISRERVRQIEQRLKDGLRARLRARLGDATPPAAPAHRSRARRAAR
jgi:RNA polymerase sigma-32 factor